MMELLDPQSLVRNYAIEVEGALADDPDSQQHRRLEAAFVEDRKRSDKRDLRQDIEEYFNFTA